MDRPTASQKGARMASRRVQTFPYNSPDKPLSPSGSSSPVNLLQRRQGGLHIVEVGRSNPT